MSSIYERKVVEYFVLKPHYAEILRFLNQGDYSATDLAVLINKTRPTIVKQLCVLESKGFVSRYVLEEDKRQKYFCISPKGIQELRRWRLQGD